MGGSTTKDTRPNAPATGGGPAPDRRCPPKLQAAVTGPAPGITAGTWLEVTLDLSNGMRRVLFVDPVYGQRVGSLSGVPGLAAVIDCLEAGATYMAFVDGVNGGQVDVTLVLQ